MLMRVSSCPRAASTEVTCVSTRSAPPPRESRVLTTKASFVLPSKRCAARLPSAGAPIGFAVTKGDTLQAGRFHHCANVLGREAPFEASPEAVERVRPKTVKRPRAIRAEWYVGDIRAGLFEQGRGPAQRPINQSRDQGRDRLLGGEREAGDQSATEIARSPDRAIPGGPVLEIIIEIDEERSAGLQLADRVAHRSGSVGNVMQNPKGVAEILTLVGKRDGVCGGEMEFDVGHLRQSPAAHFECCGGGIDTVERTDARRHEQGPAPRSASEIESFCVRRQFVPGKLREILVEKTPLLRIAQRALIEGRPLPPEVDNHRGIEVGSRLSPPLASCATPHRHASLVVNSQSLMTALGSGRSRGSGPPASKQNHR